MTSKFTPDTRAGIVVRVEAGASYTEAAQSLDIRPATARGWLQRGRREEGTEYVAFAQAIERAREVAKQRPPPMDSEDVRRCVETAIRGGNTQAMKIWLEAFDERNAHEEEDEAADPFAEVDELADRRVAKAP